MRFPPFSVAVVVLALLAPAFAVAQSSLSHHRDVRLGETVEVVADRFKVDRKDVKILHARPDLVEEITWQPNRYVTGPTTQDTVAEVVMTFHANRLARMVVFYERERTQA